MFAKFASFISRYWIAVLIAWVVVPVGLKFVAPKWDDITYDGDFDYLPEKLPSVEGQRIFKEAFPEQASKSNIVLIVARSDGRLTEEDKAIALRLADEFKPPNQPVAEGKSPVSSVMSPDQDVVGQKLISRFEPASGQAALVVLQLNSEIMALDNMPFIKSVYEKVKDISAERNFPAGLKLGVTGSAPIGADLLDSSKESIENTEWATVILVIVILMIVYRAPLLVMVPLVSIAVSYIVSIDLIALVAQWADKHQDVLGAFGRLINRQQFDYQVFKTTKIFIIVVLFGAATDYCLFLIARYREELEHGLDPRAALEHALGQTGHALTASAMTTILGLGAMMIADFGKYRSGGPTIALSLAVALLACMTVAPALLRAFGRAVFWPFGVGGAGAALVVPASAGSPAKLPPTIMGRFWNRLADLIVAHPGLILAGSFVILAVPAYHGFNVPITYDMLAELNPQRESVQGMRLLEKHFLIGDIVPISILACRPGGNFDTPEQLEKIKALTWDLNHFEYEDSHGKKSNPIHAVRSLTNPLGDPLSEKRLSVRQLMRLKAIANHPECKRLYLSSGEVNSEYAGAVTRLDLISDYDPFSAESMRLLGAVDQWLKAKKFPAGSPWHDVTFDYIGVTAGLRDLDEVNQSDTILVGRAVAVAVLIVLIFLLRRPLVSLYLIFTVVFGYLVSLGLTKLFFSWLYGSTFQGLDWKLKIFLFVILVAVGEDYNIYLVTRVVEEQRRRGLIEGLREAVVRTGGIITSCGVIMAGTFGSMVTGTLRSMIELGFAMSLGVLLDTFIIRTILVPAFLALMARWGVRSAQEVRGDVASPHFGVAGSDLMHLSAKKAK
jgi:putative drug exporter of the RND superfamily